MPECPTRKRTREDSVLFLERKRLSQASAPHTPPKNQTTRMSGPVVHNKTTTSEHGGFVTILANLTVHAIPLEEPLEYVVYQEHPSDPIRHSWATVHIYGRVISPERTYQFNGRSTSYEPQAIQLAAQEAIVQLRHLSPRVNCRSFYYHPSHECYNRPPQVANGDHEIDPTLLHLVRYIRAQDALYEHVTLDLIAARRELARLTPRRRESEPYATNLVVSFGRPIEPLSCLLL
ncbi:hypothetical protein D1007_58242 [Hordeum vulgare]|nr:hypothetical protein D1007_58242 [Hordeum vulgare]